MKHVMLLMLFTAGCTAPEAPSWTALTFNIRFDNPADGVDAWPNRSDRVADVIRASQADWVGLQEALRSQLDTLAASLPEYHWLGVGRDDGADGGEFSPIFYRTDRLQVDSSGTFWLSASPDSVGARGWDAALPRVATWAAFRDRASGVRFLALNTHFDHVGIVAREESARLIRRRLSRWQIPVVVAGDFNVLDSTRAYHALVDPAGPEPLLREAGCPDEPTFTGFEVGAIPGRRIDYLFGGPDVQFTECRVVDTASNGRYASDHTPVSARFQLK